MIELTAETPTASTVPEPWAKSSIPGLWRVKGMQLPAYVQHVSHDLMESGAASTESKAIQMAVGIIKKWAAGIPVGGETKVGKKPGHPGHIHPDVQAAAQKAVAEWEAKRARAHAQAAANAAARRDMSTTTDEETIDLAGATPNFTGNPGMTGNPGYGSVPQRRREHVHRGGETTGGMMDIAEMTQKQVKHHMATMHAVNVDGVPDAKLRRDHNTLHKQKRDNPPKRDNGAMAGSTRSTKKPRRRTEAGEGSGEQTGQATQRMGKEQGQMRGGPGPGGVSTGSANTGYPTSMTGDPTRKTGPYERYDQPWYTENPGTTEGVTPSANPQLHPETAPGQRTDQQLPTPPEIQKTYRGLQQSGLGRQQGSPTGGNDRDMDSSNLKPETGINRQQARSNVGPSNSIGKANPSVGQLTGASPPPGAVSTMRQAKAASRYKTGHSYSRVYDAWGNVIDLADVPSPNAAVRKAALKKGEALPHESGSPGKARFPLTNRTLASRAVRMVQLAKGDKSKIRRYIMATLRKKGWADLIPPNWSSSGESSGD